MSAHTPGPWSIHLPVRGYAHSVMASHPSGSCIACADIPEGLDADGNDSLANARLVAAAPELLDAMKVILAGFDKGIFVRDVSRDNDPLCLLATAVQLAALAKGQAAIKKAENTERASPKAHDAVDPPGDSNTGNMSTRETSS